MPTKLPLSDKGDYGSIDLDIDFSRTAASRYNKRGYLMMVSIVLVMCSSIYFTNTYMKNLPSKMDAVGNLNTPLSKKEQENMISQCKESYIKQNVNEFGFEDSRTFSERYFFCDAYWKKDKNNGEKGPIFFYVGNEATVELYLNNTGLMWESAQEFGALLIFAEHRYFGKSLPFGKNTRKNMRYLTPQHALADYATLITHIKRTYNARNSPVIAFGGSYGGMLGAWFRMKYPNIIDGVVAGSAPVLSFLGENPPYDPVGFSKIVTRDASVEGGSSIHCAPNVRQAWDDIFTIGKSKSGRESLRKTFRLCKDLKNEDDVKDLCSWAQTAWDYMAMGNYPYPSSYIMNGDSILPAYPVRAACSHLDKTYRDSTSRLEGLRDAVGVYYNSTGKTKCYSFSQPNEESQKDNDFWDYLYCTEMFQPMSRDGKNDMFWPQPMNITRENERCNAEWGVKPRKLWGDTYYGGRKAIDASSNIIFTNGDLDPWSAYGVFESNSPTVLSVVIKGGAHHLGLFFSNAEDPPSVIDARLLIKEHMHRWVETSYAESKLH